MKYIFRFVLIAGSINASAHNLELGTSLLTYHNISNIKDSTGMANKRDASGRLITNQFQYLLYTYNIPDSHNYVGSALIWGDNSVGSYMQGVMGVYGWRYGYHRIGLVGGVYQQDSSYMRSRNIKPFSITEDSREHTGYVPVFGIEYRPYIRIGRWATVGPYVVITPVITNVGYSLGLEF